MKVEDTGMDVEDTGMDVEDTGMGDKCVVMGFGVCLCVTSEERGAKGPLKLSAEKDRGGVILVSLKRVCLFGQGTLPLRTRIEWSI